MSLNDHPTDTILEVLGNAWASPFTTRSDYARLRADEIGEAACRGLITLWTRRHGWGRSWRITCEGLRLLEEHPSE